MTRASTLLLSSDRDSERVLSASVSRMMVVYVDGGSCTRDRERRSSIWMSVIWRLCASRMRSSFSGWEDMEGGARRRVRGSVALLDVGRASEWCMVEVGAMAAGGERN